MKYDLKKEAYERRCYKFANSINGEFDIYGNVLDMSGIKEDPDEISYLLAKMLRDVYDYEIVYGLNEDDFQFDTMREVLEDVFWDELHSDVDIFEYFTEYLFRKKGNNQGLSVKDLIAKFDVLLVENIESRNISRLIGLDESSLEYKELEKELHEVTDNYLREEFKSKYHEPLDITSIKDDELNLHDSYKKSKERDISLTMSRVKYKEENDKKRTEIEEYYDKSIFLLQLRMMESKFLEFLLEKENSHKVIWYKYEEIWNDSNNRSPLHVLEEILEDDRYCSENKVTDLEAYTILKCLAIRKFEENLLNCKDYFIFSSENMKVSESINILKMWINEKNSSDNKDDYYDFHKKRNEMLDFAIKELRKIEPES